MKLSILLSFALLVACSKTISKPTYVYKKPAGDGVAAKMGDIVITEKELMDGIEAEVYEAEKNVFNVKFGKIKTVLMEKIMEKDPKKKGLTNDEYLEKYIASGIKVSDGDINKFIKEKQIPDEHVNPQIKERIKNFLEMEKKKVAVEDWMAKQMNKASIEVFIEKPRVPTFDVQVGDAPTMGDKNAKVTVVEFSDFQCPFCAKGAELIKGLKKKYGNKVKFAFKHFPLPFHTQAKQASVATMCAYEQKEDYFWSMHDALFADQTKLDTVAMKETAKKLGVDEKKFAECLDSNKYLEKVEADIEEGKKVGVKSTPTFYVNGKLVQGAQDIEVFSELIDEDLN
jgi:protein-disulfide isomerase